MYSSTGLDGDDSGDHSCFRTSNVTAFQRLSGLRILNAEG